MRFPTPLASIVLLLTAIPAGADTTQNLVRLVEVPGIAGYEAKVREAIEMLLPISARVRADNLGNIVLRTGNGAPHTLITAPLDEAGVVVSAITDDGYLRVHRLSAGAVTRLAPQMLVGQPIYVLSANGTAVPGVTATPSAHLRAFLDPAADTRIKTIDDIWIDIGAASQDTPVDVQRLAGARLGHGAVLRILDSRTIVPPHIVDRIVAIARRAKIPLQLGTTSGGTDASVFSAPGAIDVGLSWPGRYSHSPVEVMDARDLDALVKLILALAKNY